MESVFYTTDFFINRVLKSDTKIRWIGFGKFICYDDFGEWIAVTKKDQRIIDFIKNNDIQI